MKKLIGFFALLNLLLLISCTKNNDKIEPVSIIPKPVKLEQFPGHFTLNSRTSLQFPDDSAVAEVAGYFTDAIKVPTGFKLNAEGKSGNESRIIFQIDNKAELGKEGYKLEVTKNKIILSAEQSSGFFYGIQTLMQLLPPEIFSPERIDSVKWTIPCCKIYDKPRFAWRGMHLDVSRHFFPVSFVKRYIDLIAMHKMNVFHWHLTDDNGWRIEIKKYPRLSKISAWRVDREKEPWRKVTPPMPDEKATYGGFYTQDQVKEIVAYAAKRKITIIPEIEMPGHSCEVLAAYPKLSCTGEEVYVQPGSYWPNEDIFCAGKEETFEFLENVLTEVIGLFPSEYIHIGGDEANKAHWKKCPLCQKRMKEEGLKSVEELQSWFIRRIEKFLNEHGKKMIGWDEILEGGIAPEATVMSWRGFQGGIDAARQGHDVVMTPTNYCYFDYYQANPDFEPEAIGGMLTLKKVYSFEPVPEELNEKEAAHILGAQGNVWTEFIPTTSHAEYMALPRMSALAEVVWSSKEEKNWTDFRTRLNEQFKRFDAMHVNYSKGSWKVDIVPVMENGKYNVAFETEQLNAPVHYTLDGSVPSAVSPLYKDPLQIDSSTVIKAGIFIDGKLKETFSEKEIILHKAVGKKATLEAPASMKYAGKGALSLIDGLKGSDKYNDGYWLGFEGTDMNLEIDLGKMMPVNLVSPSFYQNTGAWIFMPEKVEIEILDNEMKRVASKVVTPETTMEAKGTVVEDLSATFENVEGRYIKVRAVNMKTLPKWHEGAGNKAWIFADEVVVD